MYKTNNWDVIGAFFRYMTKEKSREKAYMGNTILFLKGSSILGIGGT